MLSLMPADWRPDEMLVPIATKRVNSPLLFERSGASRVSFGVAARHDGQGEHERAGSDGT